MPPFEADQQFQKILLSSPINEQPTDEQTLTDGDSTQLLYSGENTERPTNEDVFVGREAWWSSQLEPFSQPVHVSLFSLGFLNDVN